MDAERWGSCIAAIEEEKEEEKGAKHHYVQLELIDGWWPPPQHNNQPQNRIEGESIKFVSQCGEQQTTNTQQ